MKLKKLALALIALVATTAFITPTSAQEQGEWTGGVKFNIYSRWNGTAGVGVYARYGLSDALRVEPAVVLLCKKGMSFDISGDLQYPISLSNNLEVYPIAGLSFNDPYTWGLGINVGGGVGYELSNRINVNLGLKWIIQTQKYITNPILFSFGGGYKF